MLLINAVTLAFSAIIYMEEKYGNINLITFDGQRLF